MKTSNGSNVLGLAGYSGSGKTTLLKELIPALNNMGISVSTIKRGGHFDIDKPGKDSYEQRNAGAKEVLITGMERWALMHELRGDDEFELSTLLEKLSPVDLIIVEGFKREDHPKIEINRKNFDKPLLYGDVPNIIAIATDTDVDVDIKKLDLNNAIEIAEFIKDYIK